MKTSQKNQFVLKIFVGLVTTVGLILHTLPAQAYSAKLYALDSKREKLLYELNVEAKAATVEGSAAENYVAQFKNAEGQVVMQDSAILKGLQLVQDEIDQKQTGVKATVTYDGKIAKFSKTEDGKTKTSEEKVKGDFVMAANFAKYVSSKWSELMSGKVIEYRYGVWERMETVGFELRKVGEKTVGTEKRIELIMKPSSFIIAALVNPIHFQFSADGSRLLEMKGRVAPKNKVGEKWKDLDADVVYSY